MITDPFFADEDYQLANDASFITLDLRFGSLGQSPDYDIDLDDVSLKTHGKNSIRDFPIGTNADLDGKVVIISGNMVDMPGTDDKLTLDMRVKGGLTPLIQSHSVTATTGDLVNISIKVRFHK